MKKSSALARTRSFLASLLVDRRGASGVEYAIVAAVILVAVAAGVGALKGPIEQKFRAAAQAIA
jgi:Flp pilus assembly pilin Flp